MRGDGGRASWPKQIVSGEPFIAREVLKQVMKLATDLIDLANAAQLAGVPGFDATLDLACIGGDACGHDRGQYGRRGRRSCKL